MFGDFRSFCYGRTFRGVGSPRGVVREGRAVGDALRVSADGTTTGWAVRPSTSCEGICRITEAGATDRLIISATEGEAVGAAA